MEFREVTHALHGSTLESHSVDLARSRVELVMSDGRTVAFESVTLLKWTGKDAQTAGIRVGVIGLERLAAGEPWRLYLQDEKVGELELTCGRVVCAGEEVSGIGRSYRH